LIKFKILLSYSTAWHSERLVTIW